MLEFRNGDFSRVELAVFAKETVQKDICVYPVIGGRCTYRLSDKTVKTPEQLDEDGFTFAIIEPYSIQFLTLQKQE